MAVSPQKKVQKPHRFLASTCPGYVITPSAPDIDISHQGATVAPEPDINIIDATDDGVLLQCEVRGAAPKPRVEWQDRDGNKLPAEDPQVSERGDRYHITLQTTVTKTGCCRCVVTQEETNRRTHAEIYVAIIVKMSIWTKILGAVVPAVVLGVAGAAFLLR
ncbi:hypothetical protein PFLUV_G00051180 [Perca fluviatilis]|uniref:Ig-like domain-containing protein n=1 Tax=Perca fluviatilis TaxID=8168 RepID=A0A6A5FPZ1_PERFL|nr:hypothetical protein PFLUV_G00051180 [Perca fluviatilis]